MKRILPVVLVPLALLLAACGGGGTSGALGNKTATQVLAGALAAAKKSGSVHFDLLGTEAGKTESIEGDASNTDGREKITAGTLTIQAEVIGTGAYVEGNAGGLEDQMGLSAATAATYAGKWISIASTDAPYSSITKAVRLAGTLSDLKPTGHLTLTAATTRASHAVIGVKGDLPPGRGEGDHGIGRALRLDSRADRPDRLRRATGHERDPGERRGDVQQLGHAVAPGRPDDDRSVRLASDQLTPAATAAPVRRPSPVGKGSFRPYPDPA